MQAMRSTNISSSNLCTKVGLSVMDLAADSGLLALNPSDLVFESSQNGIAYYDFILSTTEYYCDEINSSFDYHNYSKATSSKSKNNSFNNCILPATTVNEKNKCNKKGYKLFLAKLNSQTNVESFETAIVSPEIIIKSGIPATELAMITMGILIWRNTLEKSRLLCLVNYMNDNNSVALEALKRAANKFKCLHHVLTIGTRRDSSISTNSSCSTCSYRSSISSLSGVEGMKLRVMMCQSQTQLTELPSQAIRETKFLLVPSSNPLLCLCFPLT